MNKKILVVDDEPIFMQPIFDRLMLEFGDNIIIDYFKNADQIFAYIDKKGLADVSGIVIDLMLHISNNISKEAATGGIIIAKHIRRVNESIPIVYFSLLSESEPDVKECMGLPHTIFISKSDSFGIEKLINFISAIL